jgi:hypothetical protein
MVSLLEEVENSAPIAAEIAFDWVRAHPLPGREGEEGRIIPICLWGERGVGKTQLVRGYCSKNNFGYRGYHPAHDNTGSDLVGLPMLNQELGRTEYATPYWLPSKTDALLIEQRGVIFVDEINRAPISVLQGLMELIGEGSISHSGYEIPPGWGIVAAANPPREGYFVSDLDEALLDRMIHIPVSFDLARWISWAEGAAVSETMMDFAAGNSEIIPGAGAQLPLLTIDATPRSLEYLARVYEPGMNRRLLITLSKGLLGVDATVRFLSHIDSVGNGEKKFLKADDILSGAFSGSNLAFSPEPDSSTNEFLLAALMRREPEEPAVGYVASYLRTLEAAEAKTMWERIGLDAPAWRRPLSKILSPSN